MSSSLSPIRASHSVHQLKIGRLGALVDVVDDMARNPRLLDEVRSRRFDRNDPPPPYESDPETELEESPRRLQEVGQVEEAEIISRPLSDEELLDLFDHFERGQEPYHPGRRYFDECAFEERRFIEGVSDQGRSVGHFVERVEQYRLNIMARHIIKKRWEKLRVWNPSWGVPTNIGLSWSSSSHYGPLPLSSNGSVEHDHRKWRWRWQGDRPMSTNRYWDSQPDTEHPNYRAVQLRKGTRRHEVGPRAPRSHLSPNAGASEADSFIISRPWYNFRLDVEVNGCGWAEFPATEMTITPCWIQFFGSGKREEMGTSFAPTTGGDMPSWKWKHESPEPAPVEWDDIEYTPSETERRREHVHLSTRRNLRHPLQNPGAAPAWRRSGSKSERKQKRRATDRHGNRNGNGRPQPPAAPLLLLLLRLRRSRAGQNRNKAWLSSYVHA